MQCCVVCAPPSHLSSLWPCEVVRGRGRTSRIGSGSGSSRVSSRLGYSRSGNFFRGSGELRKWTEEGDCFRAAAAAAAAAAERKKERRSGVCASLMVDPAVWVIRTTVFYVLLEAGVAVPGRPQSESDLGDQQAADKGPLAWFGKLIGGDPEEKRNKELAKLRSKWHANTKGILVRRYRVPSKAGGRKLLNAISSLLADDDTFRDVSTHKGCQIRRENAHAESVCCHNVRALFDELPTPHLVVEITVFPPGPINTSQYEKADKIEKVLRTGASI